MLSSYLSIAKDVAIVGALGFVVWFLYHSGENAVRIADMQAVQKQITANAQTQERYHSEITDAFAEANSQMGNLAHSIDAQRTPIIVRVPASGSAVPGHSPGSTSQPPAEGGSQSTAGVDIRPAVNEYEKWIEQGFADCRALKDSWPK